jgi:ribokinase
MALKTISVIGGLDYDLIMLANRIPSAGESLQANVYREGLGGKGANTAIATYRSCHKRPSNTHEEPTTVPIDKASTINPAEKRSANLDVPKDDPEINVRMVGAVGDDTYGPKFILELSRTGIDTSGIITVPNTQTSICFVLLDACTRENRCLFTLDVTANWKKEHFLRPEDLGAGLAPDLVVAQMEIEKSVVEQMIQTAGTVGIDFVLNAAPANPTTAGLYRWLTHLLVNETEAAVMSGVEVDEDTWEKVCQKFIGV